MPGSELPEIRTSIPGPQSQKLARDLRRYECRGITYVDHTFPVFWSSAVGANVRDVDGNRYIDLSGAFGVTSLGHSHPAVVEAAQRQVARLAHGMGDVHPSEEKVELARLLHEISPGNLGHVIFGSSGSDAVEAAMKTAVLATGKSQFLAFEGAYHGLSFGALAATHRKDFREPFLRQLGIQVQHLPFPHPLRPPLGAGPDECASFCLKKVEEALRQNADIAGVLIEPIQGRGGEIVPPDEFLRGLRQLCDEHHALLIADEIFTGLCRTGRWFAVDHCEVVPDLMCVGKAVSNGFPISACLGRPEVMQAWDESSGEAIHTSTFLGSPLGCAMGIASIQEMQRQKLFQVAEEKGRLLRKMLEPMRQRYRCIGDIRGKGMLLGIELVHSKESLEPDPELTWKVVVKMLNEGVILLSGGRHRNVLSLSPPITISGMQLEYSVSTLENCLGALTDA